MSVSRRDFMKMVGVSVASLALAGCRLPLPAGCYAPMVPTDYPLTARGRLRNYWMSFALLAEATADEAKAGSTDNALGQLLVSDHRKALDELVASNELTPSVADLVQEAYDAAVYHVWRSNAPITCYEPVVVDFAPASADVLVRQSAALSKIAAENTVDPETLSNAQAAIEHDMAFYALTSEQVDSLYARLVAEWQNQGQSTPSFGEVDLEITPDAKTAARFIVNLLTSP